MTQKVHAIIAPSGFSRRYHCSGSILLEETAPEFENTVWAQDGDTSHDYVELGLKDKIFNKGLDFDNIIRRIPSLKMKEPVLGYVSFCLNKLGQDFNPAYVWVEQKVKYNEYLFGTADFIFVKGKKLILIDYKYGVGVKIEAYQNFQLLCYLISAIKTFELDFIEELEVYIYQPRSYASSDGAEWKFSREILNEWEKIISATTDHCVAVKNKETQPAFQVGQWCQFCSAKYKCEEFKEQCETNEAGELILNMADIIPTLHEISEANVFALYKNTPKIKALLAAVEKFVIHQAKNNLLPGYKAVKTKEKSEWINDEDAALAITQKGVYPYKKDIISVAEAKKALRNDKDIIDSLVIKRGGSYKVIPLSELEQAGEDEVLSPDIEETTF